MIFNTHSHINDRVDEIDIILQKCRESEVTDIAVVGYDFLSSQRALSLSKSYKEIHAICGLQPEEIEDFDGDFSKFISLWDDNCCIAIGEIGLDYYYGKENKEQQLFIFEEQLKYACNYKKPIEIHCRDAHQDTFNLLEKYHNKLDGIILHCYTGSVEMMERYLKLGAYISFSGVVTFKNAKEIKEVAKKCPLDKILVETDDPYLAPVPFRGTQNQPEYVKYVIDEIAKIKGVSFNEMEEITYKNAKRVFHL